MNTVPLEGMRKAALAYAKKGWHVFPAVRSSTEKKSHKAAGRSNGRPWGATTDPAEIKRDFKKWPRANIGIATGPSRLLVLDVDTKKGHNKDGPAALRALEDKYGLLPPTYESRTPSDGRHLYFAVPDGFTVPSSTSKLGAGLDIKSEGGMVIAPPSVRPSPKGGEYKLVFDRPLEPAPEWLLELAAAQGADEASETISNGEPLGDPARIARALDVIPNDNPEWKYWNRVCLAVYRASDGSEEGFEAFDKWSQKWKGYDPDDTRDKWQQAAKSPPSRIGMGTLVYMANNADPNWDKATELDDFVAFLPLHKYTYLPTGDHWPSTSIRALFGQKGVTWLDKNRATVSSTWAPGKDKLIKGELLLEGGWYKQPGAASLNLYRPPTIAHGDKAKATRWVEHVERMYPRDCDHILDYFAQRVQQPGIKINHALVLGGAMGCGKDTLLEPVRHAVGPWNVKGISPKHLFDVNNPYVRSIILQINEASDQGEVTRNQLFERMKIMSASPPEVLPCTDKYIPAHYVLNVCGVIYTTNHRDALYLPADDRRHYVAWTDATYDGLGGKQYFDALWEWYWEGGFEHVAAFLAQRDISEFNPKASPAKTDAFWTMVNAHRPAADDDMARAIEMLGMPEALTLDCLRKADPNVAAWIKENIKSPTAIRDLLRQHEYQVQPNPHERKGMWVLGGVRRRIYVRTALNGRDQLEAARRLKARREREAAQELAG